VGEHSAIEWTHHTFNPWWGCAKVSPACNNCYAEAWSKRLGLDLWGSRGARRFFGDAHWREPFRWNRAAERAGTRARVFCASMADLFEDREDLEQSRARLWPIIEATPWLDWLLLTKRPQLVQRAVPWTPGAWPGNVWLGTTVEGQEWTPRIDELLAAGAGISFLSCEPLLGPLDLARWLPRLQWVIAGGESGRAARLMQLAWVRSLRDQCAEAGVAFHFKQWGEWAPAPDGRLERVGKKTAGRLLDGRAWDGLPDLATA
jgi:protein gp37